MLVPEADPVNRVTIVPHRMALGVVSHGHRTIATVWTSAILQEAYDEAVRLLSKYHQALDRLSRALLEYEALDEAEIVTAKELRCRSLPAEPEL